MAKTIIQNATKQSSYIFEDDVAIQLTDSTIITPNFIIGDLNSENATLVYDVTPPEDWFGNKYLYDVDTETWTQDPNWADPNAEES